MGAIEDILLWSATKLAPWRQDALRRLANSPVLTANDHQEILNLIKHKVGFTFTAAPPAPVALNKTHLTGAGSGQPLQLKSIRKVTNVNRLVPSANLTFEPAGLTVAYGKNGSGKSGFVRIFRTACRTRIENAAKLKVLADVYGSSGGPQTAEIVIDLGAGDVPITWTAGAVAQEDLLQVAVFDTSAAQLYVDSGNHIQFLPFGLALPHKLNELCLILKEHLDAERKPVTDQINILTVAFAQARDTSAQAFNSTVGAKTTDEQIAKATVFSADDEKRLSELSTLLAASIASAADITALAAWIKTLIAECEGFEGALMDAKLNHYRSTHKSALEARKAAGFQAAELFASDPLPGIGGETWRRLWLAAREYSISDAYPDAEYPVLVEAAQPASCVLCQQPLLEEASERMTRFETFVTGALAAEANSAELVVEETFTNLPQLTVMAAKDWATRLDQLRKRNDHVATTVALFKSAVEQRREVAVTILTGKQETFGSQSLLASPVASLTELRAALLKEAEALAQSGEFEQRQKIVAEQNELLDRKVLSAAKDRLIKRRNLLQDDGRFAAALTEVNTKGITQKANELIDLHLTKVVSDRFDEERGYLDITHLKIGLARKSGQTKASFQTSTGTALAKLTSEILSEGEQRALALAAFFTEVTVTEGSGPIVIDDPVSSLDRDRGLKVAARIAEEAKSRQVIVFTHDLIFFNDLCREADDRGIKTATIGLFSDGANAGKVDPAGVAWRGLSVSKRLGPIKNDFSSVRKQHSVSPADYEFAVKNLYGRLRDTYERLVEEFIFCDVVRRGVDRIETQKLRFVHLPDALAIRFHEGMSRVNTYSHDNPASATVSVPTPDEFDTDIKFIEDLIEDLKADRVPARGVGGGR
ncbi:MULTISPECIES: AAA family ATPase [Rhizobium]|uniref:AAA family ATPase n=1 Tax=Rhizobium TaxID=379 RepID=UPI000934E60F|nr:AAA family ATPase [Rhizobium leguminosarum]